MKKLLMITSLSITFTLLITAQVVMPPGSAYGQTLSDLTGRVYQYGVTFPGIMCKTRTNNDASVRNLAHGVLNRDTNDLVALNCGIPTPHVLGYDVFPNRARVEAEIWVAFGRTISVSDSDFESAFCNIFISDKYDQAGTPSSPDSTAVSVGQVRPESPFYLPLIDRDSVFTGALTLPGPFSHFISLFCRIPQGVRIQSIDFWANNVGSHP